jgi:hypothetical protein
VAGRRALFLPGFGEDSTRRYDIAVEQPFGGDEKDYRGGYILKVESAQGAIKALVPARAVEK